MTVYTIVIEDGVPDHAAYSIGLEGVINTVSTVDEVIKLMQEASTSISKHCDFTAIRCQNGSSL